MSDPEEVLHQLLPQLVALPLVAPPQRPPKRRRSLRRKRSVTFKGYASIGPLLTPTAGV